MTVFRSTSTTAGPPTYAERSGQDVTVVRPLTYSDDPAFSEVDIEVGPMFMVRFADGIQAAAFAEELTPRPRHPQDAKFVAFLDGDL